MTYFPLNTSDFGMPTIGRPVTHSLCVSPNGDGSDGSSWEKAFTTLQAALDAASTDADDLTAILLSPHATYYDINTAGDPTWAANVEIHGAHGFLIDQFLSRTTNKRNDEYGGGVENRARLLVQVIKGVKEAVGKDLSVWCRINGCEYGVTDGETLEDQKEVACMAEEAGADAIHVSAIGPTTPLNTTTARFQPALIADLAAGIKQAVKVPVIAVGRMTPESGEQLLAEGKADFIAFARALFADPELAKKVCENRYEDIRHCILCMGCRDSLRNLPGVVGVRCSVNAAIGRESECQITPAGRAKKVLVVGGGPAGMEAARVAALRGHKVTLWERDSSLGGQLKAAAVAPHKDRVATLTVYLETQLQKSKVIVELGKEATAAAIREFASDELVLATGGKVLAPEIPGLDKVAPVYAVDVLEGKAKVGQQVVIIGAELVACELAEYLADQGKNVSILRRGPEVAAKVSPTIRPYLIPRLEAAGVAMFTGVTYHQVTEKGLEITTKDGERKTLQGTIVIAAGTLPEQSLHNDVKNNISRVHLVGDCVNPRTIMDAISEGCQVGLSV